MSEIDPRYLAALHLHDNDGRRDLHQLPYLGTMDWKAILSTLAKCGYKGDMNMEIPLYFDHLPDSAMPDALSLAEKVGRDMINQFMMNRF
ncbi:MAG: hypothetical protein IIU58_01480 [Clostridia bacterium]|nr:hypothetical protein [Clostridia bacterium]